MKRYILILFPLFATINSCEEDKPKPTPEFSFTNSGCAAPCQVLFENKSKDAISYSWDFGDGTNSTETNPTKIYNNGGSFTVTLTATGEGGTASISKQVVIAAPKPTPDFSFTGGGCSAPCQVLFENKSKDAISYSWDFGDGTNSTETNPTKIYNTWLNGGSFTVTLTALGEGGTASISKQVGIAAPKPIVAIYPTSITILLRNNCPQSFTISNIGPQGSNMDYVVADDGSLGGFLNIKEDIKGDGNGGGSLPSGGSVTISVSVKPDFVSGQPSLVGATLVLSIYTPSASNFVKFPVSVEIRSEIDVLLGTWSGTWFGSSYGHNNPGQPSPTSPVNGTWILDLQTADLDNGRASGTLTWNGIDKYWVYTYDSNRVIISATPVPFITDGTIQFNNLNSFGFPGHCLPEIGFELAMSGSYNVQNPSHVYWLNVHVNLGALFKMVRSTGVGFSNQPGNPSNGDVGYSAGFVTGSKQK